MIVKKTQVAYIKDDFVSFFLLWSDINDSSDKLYKDKSDVNCQCRLNLKQP